MSANLILKLVLLNLAVISTFATYLPLDGDEWHAVNQNKTLNTKAKVPGSIYSDLRRQGILKEDIYKGYNDVNYRWVSYDNWTYERTFNVDTTILNKQRVDLVANGIDTVSTIYINDKVIGHTNNQFIRYKFDAKHLLKSGENKIRVQFVSAVHYGKQQFAEYKQKYGYVVPPDCATYIKTHIVQHGECNYNFIRKMPSSYSWDWGPAFPTQGIWKAIGIEAYDKAIIRDITVETTFKDDLSKWTLNVNLFIESAFNKEFDAILTINLDEKQLLSEEKHRITPLADGTATVKLVFSDIKQITPWFPSGVANNTQKLYDLKVSLSFPNSTEVMKQSKRIGFRTIELVEEPVKPIGLTFYFRVNGVKFWAKGSNWIPAHVLMEELTPSYVTQLMIAAKKANMNFMRVWGGGVYESDLFYELADDLGIMIWQDFMFAGALYPTDKDFLNSVDIEVKQQVRRLQHHPSIAIWAGNNEIEVKLAQPSWPVVKTNESLYKNDYIELYINHMKTNILSEDKTRPYVSSSPSNGLEDEKEKWTAKNPQDNRYGDVHYYNYNGKLWDWKFYPNPKFSSEYGFQSYPSLEAFNEVLEEKEFTYPVSKAVNHRQHHAGGEQAMEHQADLYFKLPTHGGSDKFDDLIYLSQITQAMAMKTETEHYRRTRAVDPKTGSGNTMGALYWQLNDIWQAPTWASIEFGGKWKALHYYAKHFLNNLLVSPFEDNNHTKVSLIRDDYFGDLEIDLSVKVYKWSELKPIHEINEKIKTKSFSAEVVYDKSIPDLLKESKCLDRTECVLSFEVKNSVKKLEANNFMLLTEPKNSKLVKPNIKVVEIKKKSADVFDITLSSEAVAPFVYLDFKLNSGIKGHFSDNGFFIFKNQTIVEFATETKDSVTVEKLKENLKVKSVTDVI